MLLLAAVVIPSWLLTASAWSGAIVVLIGSTKAITGWAPVGWVWDRLVTRPIKENQRLVIRDEVTPMLSEALTQLLPNGGGSLRDSLDLLRSEFAEYKEYQHIRNHDLLNKAAITSTASAMTTKTLLEVQEQLLLVLPRASAVQSSLNEAASVIKADLAAAEAKADATAVEVKKDLNVAAATVKDELAAAVMKVKEALDAFNKENSGA